MASVKATIDQKIKGKKVMIFSKSYCPYCKKAKAVFKQYLNKDLAQEDYEVWEIDSEPNEKAIQNELKKITGASSVPRVFINGKCIGGGDETEALHKGGKLAPMLKAA